jgi:23S rRNA pseudouridine1911/1915/1917 synthase
VQEPRDLSQPIDALRWVVPDEEHKERLDRFLLKRLTWRSRTSLVELIQAGKVTCAGVTVTRKAHKVLGGESVELAVPPPNEQVRHEAIGRQLDEAILFDDPDVVALAKPAGLVVHPVGRIRVNTLIQGLHWLYQHGPRSSDGAVPRICHRLDRDTSGVLLLAKNQEARSRLQTSFERRTVKKRYLAVVRGGPAQDEGTIELAIGPDEEAEIELMMTTRPDGAPSKTDYRVLERFEGASLVEFAIHTGRQHQIRVHARALGCPVLCDPLYGEGALAWPADERPVISRQALHAARLALPHPTSGEELALEAPLPADMQALLERLRGDR